MCDTLVSYWMSWEEGALAAGVGDTVGVNMVIFWQDPSPSFQVSSVSVSSKANVTWVLPNRYSITGKRKIDFPVFPYEQLLSAFKCLYACMKFGVKGGD